MNTFIQVAENLACAAFLGSDSLAIIGNGAQHNFKIGSLDASGFSIDLIHRDSPKSPFYNASESLFDPIHLSNSRVHHFISSTSATTHKDMSSTVVPNSHKGLYLMSISLGTPPLEMLAVADTGSDLIWTLCLPCESCHEQVAPLFDPSKSSTYRDLSCNSSMCREVDNLGCSRNRTCNYQIFYGDGSYSTGVLSAETLVINSSGRGSLNFPNITFGCGYDNRGLDNLPTGVVGLGRGPLSFISQLGSSIGNKFAYCLVPYEQNKSSRMDFGDNAVVSGNGTVYTPLIPTIHTSPSKRLVQEIRTSLFRTLMKMVKMATPSSSTRARLSPTFLATEAYRNLSSILKGAIDLQPVPDPSNIGLDLCYEFGKDFKVPPITFRFGGAEIVLGSMNTLIQVNESVSCFAFSGSDSIPIIGNIVQQDFKIGYDLNNMKHRSHPPRLTSLSILQPI
ncbi:LOW QUALITY PROTEIN: aspartic proteinase CDR1-like protein [Cinnamomum micranthum f. kanehirae]|uniref:Aspartic proteinase CDR1-like protein n=1 Tax=Cinnamomum micranthum f. kanehirae TaxID=337451 RepID=A0A3S3NJT9_9MAGN|nr:LOW QUALITY PROTEIN: aspartic proteinase CDR1-like protein [Cinnamomum micranthum f. kanehirae]